MYCAALETLMAPISLGDTLDIDLIPSGIEFTCSEPSLADAKDNLATRAAQLNPVDALKYE